MFYDYHSYQQIEKTNQPSILPTPKHQIEVPSKTSERGSCLRSISLFTKDIDGELHIGRTYVSPILSLYYITIFYIGPSYVFYEFLYEVILMNCKR